jgi:hypothetical protein
MLEQKRRAIDPRVMRAYRAAAKKSVGVISPKGGLSEELHLRRPLLIIESREDRNIAPWHPGVHRPFLSKNSAKPDASPKPIKDIRRAGCAEYVADDSRRDRAPVGVISQKG